MLTASMAVYSFRCVCNSFFVDRKARQLFIRMNERHTFWLNQGGSGMICSVTLAPFVDPGHRIDPRQVFREAAQQVQPSRSKPIRLRTLGSPEALRSLCLTPSRCVHKRLVHALNPLCPTLKHIYPHNTMTDLLHTDGVTSVTNHPISFKDDSIMIDSSLHHTYAYNYAQTHTHTKGTTLIVLPPLCSCLTNCNEKFSNSEHNCSNNLFSIMTTEGYQKVIGEHGCLEQ